MIPKAPEPRDTAELALLAQVRPPALIVMAPEPEEEIEPLPFNVMPPEVTVNAPLVSETAPVPLAVSPVATVRVPAPLEVKLPALATVKAPPTVRFPVDSE